jgi:hypothetical protein
MTTRMRQLYQGGTALARNHADRLSGARLDADLLAAAALALLVAVAYLPGARRAA